MMWNLLNNSMRRGIATTVHRSIRSNQARHIRTQRASYSREAHTYSHSGKAHINAEPCQSIGFVMIHRSPIHCEAVEQDIFEGQSLQYVLKLAQNPPFSQLSRIPLTMHEWIFTADMSVGYLTNIIRTRLNGIQSVTFTHNGNVVPLNQPLESLYSKDKLALEFVLTSNPNQAHIVLVNGGLPLVRGIQSFWSRNKLVLSAATMALISIASMMIEDKPNRVESTGSTERDDAVAHWNKRDHEDFDSLKTYFNEKINDNGTADK